MRQYRSELVYGSPIRWFRVYKWHGKGSRNVYAAIHLRNWCTLSIYVGFVCIRLKFFCENCRVKINKQRTKKFPLSAKYIFRNWNTFWKSTWRQVKFKLMSRLHYRYIWQIFDQRYMRHFKLFYLTNLVTCKHDMQFTRIFGFYSFVYLNLLLNLILFGLLVWLSLSLCCLV